MPECDMWTTTWSWSALAAMCVKLMTLADVYCGRAGVPINEWNMHEVHEVQSACIVTFAGCSRQR